tara:strand:- start:99 stop:428 length:330 start_codon:yes stop_codon:yes gene_type:complete
MKTLTQIQKEDVIIERKLEALHVASLPPKERARVKLMRELFVIQEVKDMLTVRGNEQLLANFVWVCQAFRHVLEPKELSDKTKPRRARVYNKIVDAIESIREWGTPKNK